MDLMEIWAHRGACHFAPENTLESFKLAVDMGADGVELDIQLAKDGEIVVIHDETIDRASNGWVKDYTLAELRKFKIPTLAEVLKLICPTGLIMNIELKTGIIFYNGIEEKAMSLVQKYDAVDQVVWSSFNHWSVKKIHELNAKAQTALLCGNGILVTGEQCEKVGALALHPEYSQLFFPGLVDDCHKRGIKVRPWTLNHPDEFNYANHLGVDAVITNRIDLAQSVLKYVK
ncbi:MAG: glycerophosphodiester phosphodiesterase [Clostridiales bacterium]|jgi:glycerophosphoryl diester phosphodiesterase|nr:glycerophosphodiester phosphodiesterase [Clostridiales bacterium]